MPRPLQPGDVLADGSRIVDVDDEHGMLVVLEVDGAELEVDLLPRAAARHERVLTARFAIGYRTRPAGPTHARALAACRALADAIAPHEDELLQSPGESGGVGRVRELRGGRFLREVRAGGRSFYTASPYRGCSIGCRFCYAQSRLQPWRALSGLPEAPWGSWVDARVDAAERLAVEIAELPPRPIKFCPIVSDPYQAIERKLRITRACVEALRAHEPAVLLLTRSSTILDDRDRIAALRQPWVGVSLPTLDDDVRRHFEPRAATVIERLDVLRTMRLLGVRTFAVVQPMLPGPVEELAEALAELTDGVSIDVLHGEESAGPLFDDPRFAAAREASWQREHAEALRTALSARGVTPWPDELPPEVAP